MFVLLGVVRSPAIEDLGVHGLGPAEEGCSVLLIVQPSQQILTRTQEGSWDSTL